MRLFILFISLSFATLSFSQDKVFTEKELTVSKWIDGTLLTPTTKTKKLAIIIAGSGPTNRDGNQNFLKSNNLKKLAEALSSKGIASFRYDKRVVKQIRQGNVDKNILFDDFVTDAKDVVTYFKEQKTFPELYIIGHSQGSLVGMLASNDVSGFISLAGAGQNIGDVIVEQIKKTAPMFSEDTERIVGLLKKGETTTDYPVALASLFNPDIQKFMISWMQYNPTEVLKKLEAPTLIINGTKDLQVSENEAKLLKEAKEDAQLKIIKNMNHVLFEIEGDDLENSKSYNESSRALSKELTTSVIDFINKN